MGCATPRYNSGEIDVPGRTVRDGQEVDWNVLEFAQGGDGAFEIPCVPEDNRGDDKVEAGGAMLLVFVGSVAISLSR